MNLRGAKAWVTGAGRGIGAAVAKMLASEGATVALTSRTVGDLERVAGEIRMAGGSAQIVPADLSQPRSVAEAAESVLKTFGSLDLLVNNAGIGRFARLADLALEDFDAMWNLNVRGVFLCTQAVLPAMEQQGSGVIVNISSLAGKNAFVNGSGYAATKWALNGMSNCLRLEVRASNIKVITVCPGSVATGFSPNPTTPEREASVLQPVDVADAVRTALLLPDRAMMSEIDLRPTNPR